MKYKGVIFDLDGTLLNSLNDLADAGNRALEKFNLPQHPVEAYQYFIGDGLRKLIERIAPQFKSDQDMVNQLMVRFKEIYSAGWKEKSCLYEGVKELTEILSANGVKLAVFSNKPHDFTKMIVEEFFPGSLFCCIRGQMESVAKKPDPQGVFLISKEMGLSIDEMIFVGDSGVDIQTGKNAGMKTIGVEWGFRTREELLSNKADSLVQKPQEIIKIVLDA